MARKELQLLLVEDCAEVRDLAAFCLRSEGWLVSLAGTLAEARAYQGESFGLILTDYELPDGLGTSLVSTFDVPLVLFSARPPEEVAPGVLGVIKKPFDPLQLAGQIEKFLVALD